MTNPSDTQLFVGIDGGATKTHATVIDAQGTTLGEANGPASSLVLSASKAWEAIQAVVQRALPPALAPQARLHLGIGVAGTELTNESDDLLSLVHGCESVRIASDAYVACLGAHGLEDGATVMVGTGIVGYKIERGTSLQVAGWGFPHDDRGCGSWLGLEAVHATLYSLDGRLQPSALTRALSRHFQEDRGALVEWACAATASDYAGLARDVVTHAEAGDPLALDLLERAGKEVSRVADALIEYAPVDFPLALAGGLAPSLENYLSKPLRERYRRPQHSASKGAALMIRNDWFRQRRETRERL